MRFPVNLTLSKHVLIEKLVILADWLTRGQWQVVSSQRVDALRTEIYHLEKTLAAAPTRPTRLARGTKPLEPITEQQKIVDMAG
jgi:hypothetical protein